MKQTLLTLTFLLCATFSIAQELRVKSFVHNEMNLEARVGGGRTDLNGKQCALIKVQVRDDIIDCTGGNVGEIETKGVVKKIFVSPDTRFLKFEFKYNYPLKVTFADYGISSLAEGGTYTLTLVDAYMLAQQPTVQHDIQTPVVGPTTQPAAQPSASPDVLPIEVNGVTFNMIRVDGGTFTMGATSEMTNPLDGEKPTHQVTLSSYYIGETEVTQSLWQAVMGSNPSKFKGDNLPVEQVSWSDCQDFIKKLNEMTGKSFRLPTEAEWEFAARGGNKSRHTQYSGSSNIDEVAWYWQNSGDKYLTGDWDMDKIEKNNCRTHPVKTKKSNELGIYDMSGNVWEWCQDYYGSYSITSQTNPTGPDSGSNRMSRGGSWYFSAWYCRSSNRHYITPDYGLNDLGLRLALSE